jgi:DNA-binding NtrC family response regulator
LRKVNVRIVAATNRDLRAQVEEKLFREDLFFRLAMVEIKLPPLAERKEDLPLLLRHFLDRFSGLYGKPIEGLTRRAEALLVRYAWPGNVRELENAIGYACMMASSGRIDVDDLPDNFQRELPANAAGVELVSVEEIQRMHARRVVEYFEGNKLRAAEVLGVSRATLYRLLGPRTETTSAGESQD